MLRFLGRLLLVLAALGVIALAAAGLAYYLFLDWADTEVNVRGGGVTGIGREEEQPTAALGERVEIAKVGLIVKRGEPLDVTIGNLVAAGLVDDARLFRLYLRCAGVHVLRRPPFVECVNLIPQVKAGPYQFPRRVSPRKLAELLTSGQPRLFSVMIRPGENLRDVAAAFDVSQFLSGQALLEYASTPQAAQELGLPGAVSLEGYLYPETYKFAVGVSERQVAKYLVEQFKRRWKPEWDERLTELHMTRQEVGTLASVIQKESGQWLEMRLISAVFHNRLRYREYEGIGGRLQSDPTVMYGLGKSVAPTPEELLKDHEYNTYTRPGLPKGPICNPDMRAVSAALFPDEKRLEVRPDNRLFYFVAINDPAGNRTGFHVFTRKYADHDCWVDKLLRGHPGRSCQGAVRVDQ